MSRRSCRDCIFKLVYQHDFNEKLEPENILESLAENMEIEEQKYVLTTYNDIITNFDTIKDSVSKAIEGYVVTRVYKVDLAILIVAFYEINYLKEPVAVVINEAVELAKKYSNEKSPSFINGVLSKIVNNK